MIIFLLKYLGNRFFKFLKIWIVFFIFIRKLIVFILMGFVLMIVIVWFFFSNGIVVKVFDKNLYLSNFFV